MTIFEKLKEIISSSMPEIDLTDANLDTRLHEDLGLDSLSMMMVAMLIEEEFGFEFDGEINFKTVGDICEYISEMTK